MLATPAVKGIYQTDAAVPFVMRTAGNGHFRQADETPDLPYDLSLCLFRVAQEALANAVKHGKAKQIAVQLAQNASSIRLVVKDDGIGFDVSSAFDGLGLVSMQERVRIVGGTFTLTSIPGQGTTVEAVAETARAMRAGAG